MSKFSQLAGTVAREYEKAGMGKNKAEHIGGAVAYKEGVSKLGKKKFLERALKARKANK